MVAAAGSRWTTQEYIDGTEWWLGVPSTAFPACRAEPNVQAAVLYDGRVGAVGLYWRSNALSRDDVRWP